MSWEAENWARRTQNRTAQTAEYIIPQCEKDSMQRRQKENNRFLPDRRADHLSILRSRLPFASGLRPERG